MRRCSFLDLKILPYEKALYLQRKLNAARVENKIQDILLLLEHEPVITKGVEAKPDEILVSLDTLKEKGIPVYETERGGHVTFHGPGQIVGYPILKLDGSMGLSDYINKLEDVILKTVGEYGISAKRADGYRGVWVGKDKLAAIGLAVKKKVTMHGFALNVNTNLENFSYIKPCGFEDKGVTSMEKILSKKIDIEEIKIKLVENFSRVFNVPVKKGTISEFEKLLA